MNAMCFPNMGNHSSPQFPSVSVKGNRVVPIVISMVVTQAFRTQATLLFNPQLVGEGMHLCLSQWHIC